MDLQNGKICSVFYNWNHYFEKENLTLSFTSGLKCKIPWHSDKISFFPDTIWNSLTLKKFLFPPDISPDVYEPWTNLVVLKHPMLHTKLKGHWPFGYRRFLSYMGMVAILVMWPGPFEQTFIPGPFEQTFIPSSHGGSIWNLTLIGPVVSEEMFKCGRPHKHLSYKLTNEALAQVS